MSDDDRMELAIKPAPVYRGINTSDNTQNDGKNRRDQGQFQRCGQALENHVRNRLCRSVGNTEIKLQRTANKAKILNVQGVI